uniref:Uncharacterized protein n=1 Tax=Arcella intermedia TaxID=1963864 RepID=A0A6B2LJ16_9EUKA
MQQQQLQQQQLQQLPPQSQHQQFQQQMTPQQMQQFQQQPFMQYPQQIPPYPMMMNKPPGQMLSTGNMNNPGIVQQNMQGKGVVQNVIPNPSPMGQNPSTMQNTMGALPNGINGATMGSNQMAQGTMNTTAIGNNMVPGMSVPGMVQNNMNPGQNVMMGQPGRFPNSVFKGQALLATNQRTNNFQGQGVN